MMKQQLKDIKELPPSTKEVGSPQEDLQVRTEELFVPLENSGRGHKELRTRIHHQSSSRIEEYTSDNQGSY
eukprot:12923499-Prorocentrum_lima.AAC.1